MPLSQHTFLLVIAGKAHVLPITSTMALLYLSGPVRHVCLHNTKEGKKVKLMQTLIMLLITPVILLL